MNAATKIVVLALLIIAGVAGARAEDKVQVTPKITKDLIVTNLVQGMLSDNKGLRESSAFMLGEQKAVSGVVPLMKMLRDSEDESSRIVAALALSRIGDSRGAYAVKQSAKFDRSERVRTLSAWFYNQYVRPGSFAFIAVDPADAVEYGSR